MLNPTKNAKLVSDIGRLYNELLIPSANLNPLKVRNMALKVAKDYNFNPTQKAKFVRTILDARSAIANELNKDYLPLVARDTVLVVNLRQATNQLIKKAVLESLQGQKRLSINKLAEAFNIVFANAYAKQQADFDAILANRVDTLINRLVHGGGDNVAQLIKEYSPFGTKGTENLADMVKDENWSLLSIILVNMESIIQAFNRMGIKISNALKRRLYAKFFNVSASTGRSLVKRKNSKIIKHHGGSEFNKLYGQLKYDLHNRDYVRRKAADVTLDFIVNELDKRKILRVETNKQHLKVGDKVYSLFEKAIDYNDGSNNG